MLAAFFLTQNDIFYLSESNRRYFLHIKKIWAEENSIFLSHVSRKIVSDNRSSEQVFTETVCWVPL